MNDPDIYDWGEMRLVLQFLGQSIGDYCVIEDDNLYEVLTYVDVSYATHDNMRGRTGGCMKFGSEVVGASNYMPFSILLDMYMENQGYKVKQNQLMRYNVSAMKMDKNGRNSCTGNYRHINIRYFFVKDRMDKKDF